MAEIIRYNLGCGELPIDGYRNVDLKAGAAAYPLDAPDASADEIRASHLLEHFPHGQVADVVRNWVSKLKPGGVLKVAVPDFNKITDAYHKGDNRVMGYVCGGQIDDNDYHKSIFDEPCLRALLRDCGLIDIQEWTSEIQDCASLPISLNLQGTKPSGGTNGKFDHLKIAAVMSIPRLIFSDNIFSAVSAIIPLGISLDRGQGVFWGQVLTRMLEKHLDADYIITLDYDTWFTKEHVVRMLQLAQEHPEFDAFVPMQAKREGPAALFGIFPKDGQENAKEIRVPRSMFEVDCTPIDTGHFGLTVIRTAALKGMSKPWFQELPDPKGGWDDGRTDSDIYFWKKFRNEGHKAALCNNVRIGHLQMMCSFSGEPQNNWAPTHLYCNDLQKPELVAPYVPHVEYLK